MANNERWRKQRQEKLGQLVDELTPIFEKIYKAVDDLEELDKVGLLPGVRQVANHALRAYAEVAQTPTDRKAIKLAQWIEPW